MIESTPRNGEPALAGQTVVVLGGTTGIGHETARRARDEGADVVITAADPDRVQRVGLELGASIAAFEATDISRLERFFASLPAIDHVLIGPTGPYYAPLAEMDFDAAHRDVEAQLWLILHVARVAGAKIRPGGTLTFVAGTTPSQPTPGLSITATLAAGMPFLARNLARELAPVRVNCVGAEFAEEDAAAMAVHLMTHPAVTGATYVAT